MRKVMIMDEATVMRSLARITHEIIERTDGGDSVCILGVKSRGTTIAKILAENLKPKGIAETAVIDGLIDNVPCIDDAGIIVLYKAKHALYVILQSCQHRLPAC